MIEGPDNTGAFFICLNTSVRWETDEMSSQTPTARLLDRAKLQKLKRTNENYFDSELAAYEILMRQPNPLPSDGKEWDKRSMMLTRARHQQLAFLILMAKLSGFSDNVPTEKTDEYAALLQRTATHIDPERLRQLENEFGDME